MIYTLTLNPSIDYIVELSEVKLGELNRTQNEAKFPGGKGINVSRLLKRMGIESIPTGFLGGFTGRYIEDYLQKEDIQTDFVQVAEDTRINIKLKTKTETEINAKGPAIQEEDLTELKRKISQLSANDHLVLAGSVPSSMPATIYEELVKICSANGVTFTVDAEGDLLKKVLPYKPMLIKPNHHELGELFEVSISNAQEAIPHGKKLIEMGAQHVIVSLGGHGAVLITKDGTYFASAPKGVVKSTVGAGDSMVAGFLASLKKQRPLKEAFQYSVASGSATAFSVGLCTKEKADELLPSVTIKELFKEGQQ